MAVKHFYIVKKMENGQILLKTFVLLQMGYFLMVITLQDVHKLSVLLVILNLQQCYSLFSATKGTDYMASEFTGKTIVTMVG